MRQAKHHGGAERYSALTLVRRALGGTARPAWRNPELKPRYDAVIVGGGGHGLAAAYHLARDHQVERVAVIERGWIGGGNTGRNTTVVRSNYIHPESARLYDLALSRYERLSRELNFNIMFSPRGMVTLAHTRHDLDQMARWVNAMRLNAVDSELLDRDAVFALAPALDRDRAARFPVAGGFVQRRAGTARHDAVAWGYARAADALGVDIVQGCAVTGVRVDGGRVRGVDTTRGPVTADVVGIAAASGSSALAAMAGFRLPIVSYPLQAMVSEPVKPMLDTVVLSPATGVYLSQSDKGEMVIGAGLDRFASFAQRGDPGVTQATARGAIALMPDLARLKLLRQWAGAVDVTPDSSPILGPSPLTGLHLDCGWGTGGFKAIPAGGILLAHSLATGRNHPLGEPFGLDRFAAGRLIDEAAASGIAH